MIFPLHYLPKKSEEEKLARKNAIQESTKNAILVPYQVMETAFSGFGIIREMVEQGNPNSITDAGVGALALNSCIKGAFLNVKINSNGLDDKQFVNSIINSGNEIVLKAAAQEAEILKLVHSKIEAS